MSFREHAPYHERRLEQQTLDALLRIEDVIGALREDLLAARMEKQVAAMEPEPQPATKGKRK